MYNDVIHHHVAPSTTVVAKRLVAADNRRPLRSRRINAEIRRHGEFGGRRINAEARRHGDFGGRRINAEARRHGDSWDAGLTRRLGDTETLGCTQAPRLGLWVAPDPGGERMGTNRPVGQVPTAVTKLNSGRAWPCALAGLLLTGRP